MIHHQDETIIASYDFGLIRRIARYAAPFRGLIAATLVCLVVATAGEVLLPVIIQRTIDHHIMEHWNRLDESALGQIASPGETRTINGAIYLREDRLDRIPRAIRDDLREQGLLSRESFTLIPKDVAKEHPEILEALGPSLRDSDHRWISFPRSALEPLSARERRALLQHQIQGLHRQGLLFLGVLLAVLVGAFGQVYLTAFTGQLVMKKLRHDLFSHTLAQHLGFLGDQPVGRLVTRITNDVETINDLFTSVLAELARNVSLMFAVVVTMFALNPRLATITLVSMVPVLFITDIIRRKAREAYRAVRHAVSDLNAYLSEHVSGMEIVQIFVQQKRSNQEFTRKNETLTKANLAEMQVFAVFRPLVDFMSSTSLAVVIFFGATLLQAEIVSLGVLIAFTNLIRRFYMPVMTISEQFTLLQSAMAGSERVFDLLDQDQRIPDTGNSPLPVQSVSGAVEFRDVHFSYRPGEPILKGVSFRARPGELIALVGSTGSGKTTVINLLTRLWDVTGGSVQLEGRDVRDYRLAELRQAVQQIQQDVFLFNDTIRNNITLGKDVADEKVLEACRAVQVAAFIEGLPQGLDTPLTEGGSNISAGQRQLLAFARVLIHDPPVLVLDEATSSIDSETEKKLQQAVDTITRGRTSLVVAHRLSTIQHAHRILVLSRGELVESGTHQELLDRDGLYATLHRFQFDHPSHQQRGPAPPRDTPQD
ncbi:ATP-binding cassette, subfamily B [Alkalispirochaeta americana]|uniref:ATP-binding cassette, subfamily B n=1 Tax=Alkalispirochaeta americana TaxID=159291 RepID=A0A1N6W338_9SPIO|nr:ABC transporter ATP-binding protein [Alkalispirochaeta americana]SIQ84402.1 ATP-binding cassette, subfamily B [Alkalispirochaeta americana]